MNKHPLNTLLIDDNEENYATTRELLVNLENWEINLEWVSTYEDALARLSRDNNYDICLLNCCLGKNKGLDFISQAVKQNGKLAPLILLTEPDDNQTALKALEAGAADYLVKGQIDASLLERSIRYVVKTKQLQDSLEAQVKKRTAALTVELQNLRQELNQHKQEEEALREHDRQYRLFFDIDIYGVEVLDSLGNITDCNPTYQKLLGYSRAELVGQHITRFTTTASAYAFQKSLDDLQATGYTEGERELVRQDGSTMMVWSRSRALYNANGAFNGIVTFSRDITERMKAVKQISTLARALEQSPMALLITDIEGNIEYANFEFTGLTGHTYEDIAGSNLQSLNLGQQSPESYQDFLAAFAAGEEWQGDLNSLTTSGESYWATTTVAPMFDSRGMLTHFIVMQEDITARKDEEIEALRSQRRIGDLMTEQIGDLTSSNEALQREIEERKQAEAALQRVKNRLEAQYRGIPLPTYTWEIIDDDFVLVDFNTAAEEESGGRIDSFKNRRAGEIFKDRPQVLGDFLRCSIEKGIVRREAPYQKVTTGANRYFVTTYNYVEPNLILVHIQDITEHKELEREWQKCRERLDALAITDDTELLQAKETLRQEMVKRQKAELALQQAEERLKAIAGNIDERLREQYRGIPIPTYSWQSIGGEFILVDFNNAAAKNMGRIVDFFGKPASEIFKDRPQILADFKECYDTKETVVREAPYQMITTGETRFFVTTYHFVEPNLIVDHIQDITDQKAMEAELEQYRQKFGPLDKAAPAGQPDNMEALTKQNQALQQELAKLERAEESLRQSRARLRAQYNGIPIPTYSWQSMGKDFVLTDYNTAAEKSTQGRIAEFMGKSAGQVFKDRPEVLADFERCFREKKTLRRESHYQLVTADETKHFVTTYNFVPPNMVMVYIEDTTEYKRIEERLRQGEAHVELKCRLSPQMTLTFVNDAYCWYFNHSRQDLIGKGLPFIHQDDLQQVKMHLASLRQESPVGTIEYRVIKPNGKICWQRWVNQTIFDHLGNVVEIQAVGRDITRQKAGK